MFNPLSFSYFKTSPEINQLAVMMYVRFLQIGTAFRTTYIFLTSSNPLYLNDILEKYGCAPGHHFPVNKSKKTQGNTGFVLCWDHFRDRFVDHFASRSNLRASVINVHGGGVGLMVVLSVFSERVSNAQTPGVCLQARQWQPSLDKLFPNKLGSWKHFTC